MPVNQIQISPYARQSRILPNCLIATACSLLLLTDPLGAQAPSLTEKPYAGLLEVLPGNLETWKTKPVWAEAEPAVMLGSAPPTASDEREEPGFHSLFDGRTLDGWQAVPAPTADAWTVQDGMIVGNGDRGVGYLVYDRDKQLANFELRFRYRFVGRGNSGVSIRAAHDRSGKRLFQSYHADLGHAGIGKQILGAWDFHTPGRTEHRCHCGDRLVISTEDQPQIVPIQDGLRAEDIRQGDWNEVRIIARDNHFQFYINGKLASEFTEHLPTEQRLLSGMLQLQIHDPAMIVHFKDLRIKRL
ncbi:MAG: DUF1080 domain-containing protein [Mariniblastus sp.]|nr:DUF1080 domain-containing protein [Mariniblastus sp.]